MTPQQYAMVEEVFQAARRASPGERLAYVARVAADPVVTEAVVAMLDHDHTGASALEEAVQDHVRALEIPRTIGPFEIVDRLGEGGMGVVYHARQHTPRRAVALKVVRPGALSDAMRRRFAHEIDVLGQLSHPGIAQVFDAGTVTGPDGTEQPYFAMELVEGRELLAHARTLDLRGRVTLLGRIGRAVEHAHRKGIIHRDLKPANVLVTPAGAPKVLDFGVARGLGEDRALTATGQLVGTLGYMSPEQARGDRDAVDVRSDVHALGAIAYEVLTGHPPFDVNGRDLLEAARHVASHEPTRLSRHDAQLAGDLETIVMKALAKAPEDRYRSAAEFADDLRRFLDDEPVLARAPSRVYQFRKYARRHRRVLGAMTSIAAVLLIATITSTIFAVRARTSRDEAALREAEARVARAAARERATVARAVSGFLADRVLAAAKPENRADRDVSLRAVLDEAAPAIDIDFPDAPEVRGALHLAVGDAYRGLSIHDRAEKHLRASVDAWERVGGPRHPDALQARHVLAMVYEDQSRYEEAIALDEVTLERRRAALGDADPATIRTILTLGSLYDTTERRDEARRLFEEAIRLAERHLGPEDSIRLTALNNLAVLHYNEGRTNEAVDCLERVLSVQRRTLGDDHPNTLTSINNLGAVLRAAGHPAEAWPYMEEAVTRFRAVMGADHADTLTIQQTAALTLKELGRVDEAETLFRETLERQREKLGDDHLQTARTRGNLGLLYLDEQRYTEAEPLLLAALRVREDHLPAGHRATRITRYNLARLYLATERASEALPLFAAVADESKSRDPDHWLTGVHLMGYGDCLATLDRRAEAEAVLLDAHGRLDRSLGPAHARTRRARERLAHWYTVWERPDDAASWGAAAGRSPEESAGLLRGARGRSCAVSPRRGGPAVQGRGRGLGHGVGNVRSMFDGRLGLTLATSYCRFGDGPAPPSSHHRDFHAMDRRKRVEEARPLLAALPAHPELTGGGPEVQRRLPA